MDKNAMKKMAAERSVDFVEDNMILGLGTGSTVVYMVEALAKRVQAELKNKPNHLGFRSKHSTMSTTLI